MAYLRSLPKGADSVEEQPFVLLLLPLLVYNVDPMAGTPAAILEREANLRTKSQAMGGA